MTTNHNLECFKRENIYNVLGKRFFLDKNFRLSVEPAENGCSRVSSQSYRIYIDNKGYGCVVRAKKYFPHGQFEERVDLYDSISCRRDKGILYEKRFLEIYKDIKVFGVDMKNNMIYMENWNGGSLEKKLRSLVHDPSSGDIARSYLKCALSKINTKFEELKDIYNREKYDNSKYPRKLFTIDGRALFNKPKKKDYVDRSFEYIFELCRIAFPNPNRNGELPNPVGFTFHDILSRDFEKIAGYYVLDEPVGTGVIHSDARLDNIVIRTEKGYEELALCDLEKVCWGRKSIDLATLTFDHLFRDFDINVTEKLDMLTNMGLTEKDMIYGALWAELRNAGIPALMAKKQPERYSSLASKGTFHALERTIKGSLMELDTVFNNFRMDRFGLLSMQHFLKYLLEQLDKQEIIPPLSNKNL